MPDDRFLHRRAGHSQKVNLLTDLEYRVWTQYILSADDFGVMRASAVTIQADNDHLSNRPAKVIQRCIEALAKGGLLRIFEHQNRRYVYQHDWQDWQKVSYPRTTNQPAPPAEALAECEPTTQELFRIHPGGAGRKRKERSENVPETVSECSPLTRAGAPAKRLTANGERPTVVLQEKEKDAPIDHWLYQVMRGLYPGNRVTRDFMTVQAFTEAMQGFEFGPHAAWGIFQDTLAENRKSHEWRVKGMIPSLKNYIMSGQWQNEPHPKEPPAADRMTRSTSKTAAAVDEIMKEPA